MNLQKIKSKETEIDDSSFEKETKTRIIEMSLVAYNKSAISINNPNDVRTQEIIESFSSIFKDKDVLNDNDPFY